MRRIDCCCCCWRGVPSRKLVVNSCCSCSAFACAKSCCGCCCCWIRRCGATLLCCCGCTAVGAEKLDVDCWANALDLCCCCCKVDEPIVVTAVPNGSITSVAVEEWYQKFADSGSSNGSRGDSRFGASRCCCCVVVSIDRPAAITIVNKLSIT